VEGVLAEVEVVLDQDKYRVRSRPFPLLLKELVGQHQAQVGSGAHDPTIRRTVSAHTTLA
jgi:hypothetical protein